MRYTNKKRKEIYLKALELLAKADITESNYAREPVVMAQFVCHAISQSSDVNADDVPSQFPEAYAFKNPEYHDVVWLREYNGDDGYCDSDRVTGNEFRQLVLIFAAELCDDPEFLA